MSTNTTQCTNCQLLEKKIACSNSSLKKLLTLKAKIVHTDALIRKYKEQKDEYLLLRTECDKAQSFCAKYEIDLKHALEELHSLRKVEKDSLELTAKFNVEISSLKETLEAEKALVKQYKCLVEKDEKTEVQLKDKLVKDLERKLNQKDKDLLNSKENTRTTARKLSLVSKSHVKALKLLQKLGWHPALERNLTAGDRKSLVHFSNILDNEEALFKNASQDQSDDEILDESQKLESLLFEETSQDITSVSENLPTLPPHVSDAVSEECNVIQENDSGTLKSSCVKGNSIADDNDEDIEWEDVADPVTDMCTTLVDESMRLPAVQTQEPDEQNSIVCVQKSAGEKLCEIPVGVDTLLVTVQENKDTEVSNNDSELIESQDILTAENVNMLILSEPAVENFNSGVELQKNSNLESIIAADPPQSFEENTALNSSVNDSANVSLVDDNSTVLESTQVDIIEPGKTDTPTQVDIIESGKTDKSTVQDEQDTLSNTQASSLNSDLVQADPCGINIFSDDPVSIQTPAGRICTLRGGSLNERETFTVPVVPFTSNETLFQTKDKVNAEAGRQDCAAESSNTLETPVGLEESDCDLKKTKKADRHKLKSSLKQVAKIRARMDYSLLLKRPLSPLPPSPPSTPSLMQVDSNLAMESACNHSEFNFETPDLLDLFGSDSESSKPQQNVKTLQHQESEGFELDPDSFESQNDAETDLISSKPYSNSKNDSNNFSNNNNNNRSVHFSKDQPTSNSLIRRNAFDEQSFDKGGRRQSSEKQSQSFNSFMSNSRLFTDVSLDRNTGRCKVSVRLPDNIESVSNVRFELDTISREFHLDYAPMNLHDKSFSNLRTPESSHNIVGNQKSCRSALASSPTKNSSSTHLNDDSVDFALNSSSHMYNKCKINSNSARVINRRISVPPATNTMHRYALERRAMMFGNREDKRLSPEQILNPPEKPLTVQKPAAILLKSTRRMSKQSEGNLEGFGNNNSKVGPLNISCQNLKVLEEPTKNATESNATIDVVETGKPVANKKAMKRKLQDDESTTCNKGTPESSSGNSNLLLILESDSEAVHFSKLYHNASKLYLQPCNTVLKVLRNLRKLKGNDKVFDSVFFRMAADFCNPTVVSEVEKLVDSILVYFLRSKVDLITGFSNNNSAQLTLSEEFIIALLKRVQERKGWMKDAMNLLKASIYNLLFSSNDYLVTGYSSLCRLFVGICRMEGNVKAPRVLCYNLLLKKHFVAHYLIANIIQTWPAVLNFSNLNGQWQITQKVFSFLLLRSVANTNETLESSQRAIQELCQLSAPDKETSSVSLVQEILRLLEGKEHLEECKELCQLLLLLSCTEGWSWTKSTVITPLLSILDLRSTPIRPACLQLMGYLLHCCIPNTKEDRVDITRKLKDVFLQTDDNEVLVKEACIFSLLHLQDQLDASTVSQMKKWVNLYKKDLSVCVLEDSLLAGFL